MSSLSLKDSNLYIRRQSRGQIHTQPSPQTPEERFCFYCLQGFGNGEQYVSVDGQFYHIQCFNCYQCFNPLLDEIYFNFEGKFYCEYDFKRNYAPICQKCKEYVMGTVIKTVRGNYHPNCLNCDACGNLIEGSLHFDMMKNLCENCHKNREKHDICAKCRVIVLPEERLLYKGDIWHAEHFECIRCGIQLDNAAQIWHDRLYCHKCYDRYVMVTCAHCHRVIDLQQERAKEANGKHYHINHFLCHGCGLDIQGEHIEVDDRNYCKQCYLKETRKSCSVCNSVSEVIVFNKRFCRRCFRCVHCQKDLYKKSNVINFDYQPICRKCFDKLPKELRKRIKNGNSNQEQEK